MIPRVLHQIWVGPAMPVHFQRFVDGWRRLHPTWEHRLWTEADAVGLVNQDVFDRAELIARGSEGQLRADVLRYEVLSRHGGVYVDVDMECLRPIDELATGPRAFVAWEVPNRWIGNSLIGSVPRHPFVVEAVRGLAANVHNYAGERPNVLTGPQYLTRKLTETVTVYPREHFYPYAHDELERARESFPNSYAVHHWNNQRKRRGRPLEVAK